MFSNDDVLMEFAFGEDNMQGVGEDEDIPRELNVIIQDMTPPISSNSQCNSSNMGTINQEVCKLESFGSIEQTLLFDTQDNKENISNNFNANCKKNLSKMQVTLEKDSNKRINNECKQNEKIINMVLKTEELSSQSHNNENTYYKVKESLRNSKEKIRVKSKSNPRVHSLPKENANNLQPEMINVVPINNNIIEHKQIKRCESMKRIGSEQRSRGPGSIKSNRNNSINSEKESKNINLISNYIDKEENKNSKQNKRFISDEIKTKNLNQSHVESEYSYDSKFESNKRMAGSIYKGNSADKPNNATINIINNKNNHLELDDTTNILRRSADNSKSIIQESPVVQFQKDLKFETDFSKEGNEDIGELNELLQLNDY